VTAAGSAGPPTSQQLPDSGAPKRKPRALDLAFDVDTGNASANHMLLIMARLGNASLRCYASEKTLADRCGFSVSSASRAINHLKACSYIKQIICKPRTRRTNTYQLCINLWITRVPELPSRTLTRSGWTVEAGHVDRQNLGSESGSKRHAARPLEGMSIGDCLAPLVAEAKARSQ